MTDRLIELDRQKDVFELGRVFLENGTGDLKTRVVPYGLRFRRNGEPDFAYETKTVLGRMEYEGMMSMYELAKMGFSHVFWISPPGGPANYPEGRLVVGKVVKTDNEVEFECRGVPILDSEDKLLEEVSELIKNGGVNLVGGLGSVEDLRSRAIGINLDDEQLWDFCKHIFGMGEVWDVIKRGEDVVRASEVIGVAGEVLVDIRRRFGVVTPKNSLQAGIMFEQVMAVRGWSISGGNHGGTNMSVLNGQMGVFDKVYVGENKIRIDSMGNVQHYCKNCGCWYSGDKCPFCS